jgi:iron complex transport system ATP-binding protein
VCTSSGAEPFSVTNAGGRKVVINDASRIVSIDGAITEILYAIGRDKQVVAVDTTSLYPAASSNTHFAKILVQLAVGERRHGAGTLLLDEPTASLDLRHQLGLLRATSRSARKGIAVVAVLHDLNLAALFADRVVVLQNGRVAANGRPSDTINDDILRRVFGVENAANRIPAAGIPFVLPHAVVSS